MRLIPLKYLKENSCIAINVIDNQGRFMLKNGQKISKQGIQILNNLGVEYVYITDQYCFHESSSSNTRNLEGIYQHILSLREIG